MSKQEKYSKNAEKQSENYQKKLAEQLSSKTTKAWNPEKTCFLLILLSGLKTVLERQYGENLSQSKMFRIYMKIS